MGHADKAEKVKPYLEQHQLAVRDVQAGQSKLEAARVSQQTTEAAYQLATEQYEQAQQELSKKESPLLLRLDQLQQALVIQQELDHVGQQVTLRSSKKMKRKQR